jgi:hypothetical protein
MYGSDSRMAWILMKSNIEEAERVARSHQLANSMERVQPSWRRFVGLCGAWLITMGERLEQYAPVQASQ